MAIKQRSDSEATALLQGGGITDSATGVQYPSADSDPWLAPFGRMAGRMADLLVFAANLKVEPIDNNDDAIAVLAGRCTISSTVYAFTGADPAVDGLTDNDTTYIWAEDTVPGTPTGTLQINSAIDATGWPVTNHLKLAEVTVSGGVITQIIDRRLDGLFSA